MVLPFCLKVPVSVHSRTPGLPRIRLRGAFSRIPTTSHRTPAADSHAVRIDVNWHRSEHLMSSRFSRRRMMQGVGSVALAQAIPAGSAAPTIRRWPIEESTDTPKLCLAPGDGGGPLPASIASAISATGQAGRSGGGGYGGFLAAKPGTKSVPSTENAAGAPSLAAAYQRIRQLGVTHL